ncbi:MAG: alpha/beta hydrolase [Alphaproteobacteria bacterium]|nr:alpha/beta hydrolase [Alphaproteobacteria bacterium]
MAFARVGDLDMYYERAGSGPPLLFISGSGGDLRNKPNQMDGPLPKAFDVLSYDQRGLGQTSKPDKPYTMVDYADDAARLMDHVGWKSARVIGVSFGGMVAQEFVLRHPQKVERLVLACTSPGGAGGASYPFHTLEHMGREERARFLIQVNDTRRDEAWQKANPEQYQQFVALGATDAYAGEPGREMGYRRQLEARSHHDTYDRLPQIDCPVMIAAGKYDGIALPSSQHNMQARIKGAVLQFFEGGHLFMIQDRAAMPAMIKFLQG